MRRALAILFIAGCFHATELKAQWGDDEYSYRSIGHRIPAYQPVYSQYKTSAAARVAAAELRSTVNNLTFQKELVEGRIEELEEKIANYQSYTSSTTREFWDRFWAIKAQGAKTDLSAYDKEIQDVEKTLKEKLNTYDGEMREARARAIGQKENKEINELNGKIAALQREKLTALAELRAGLYCSKCKRPASMIQREEKETFQKHLGRVKGKPEPATQAMLLYTAKKYDAKIESFRKRIESLRQSIRRQEASRDRRLEALGKRSRDAQTEANERVATLKKRRLEASQRSVTEFRNKLQQVKEALMEKERENEEVLRSLREELAQAHFRQREAAMELMRRQWDLDEAESALRKHEQNDRLIEAYRLQEQARRVRELEREKAEAQQRMERAERQWAAAKVAGDRNRDRQDRVAPPPAKTLPRPTLPSSRPTPGEIAEAARRADRLEAARREAERKLEADRLRAEEEIARLQEQMQSGNPRAEDRGSQVENPYWDAPLLDDEVVVDLLPWDATKSKDISAQQRVEQIVEGSTFNGIVDWFESAGRRAIRRVDAGKKYVADAVDSLNEKTRKIRKVWRRFDDYFWPSHPMMSYDPHAQLTDLVFERVEVETRELGDGGDFYFDDDY